jgi:twitching motility protein PilI
MIDTTLPAEKGIAHRGQAKRTRMREFQTQLIERMRSASSSEDMPVSQLGVVIGGQHWLINLQLAGEVMQLCPIAKVPMTQDWFLGLMNVRGNLLSVVELARFHGLAATPMDKSTRIISFSPALGLQGAILVERVMGLRNATAMTPYSGSLLNGSAYIGERYVDPQEQLWTELDLSLLAKDNRFLDIGRT